MTANAKTKQLSQDDLLEFRLRQQALMAARNQYELVQEAVIAWTQRMGKKHKVKGRFTVQASDGTIIPEAATDG